MKYDKIITLKNGAQCCLRNAVESDGQAVLDHLNLVYAQTDFLGSYPDSFDVARECRFLKERAESENEMMILAIIDGVLAGDAGFGAAGELCKVRHRAEFGVSVKKEFWGLGIGGALLNACIACAKKAGYVQLELDAAAENTRALTLYQKAGFVEYGRNPKGFLSRTAGFQEVVYMRLEL